MVVFSPGQPAPRIERDAQGLPVPQYIGLRLSSEEYLQLPDDGCKYELVHGIVIMSPSPGWKHQSVSSVLFGMIENFVRTRKLGRAVFETDVTFEPDTTYRPDISFFAKGRVAKDAARLEIPPDLIVEFLSKSTRALDRTTKFNDYATYGVREYWIVDTDTVTAEAFKLEADKYVPVSNDATQRDTIASLAIPGLVINMKEVRDALEQ